MRHLLTIASQIDKITFFVARVVRWGLLVNALLITGNAFARKFFAIAYPSAYDLQWHFFAAVVLLMSAYALQRNEHVRIDILASRLGPRGLAWLDLVGTIFVLVPICIFMVWIGSEGFLKSLLSGETRATRESTSEIPAWIMKGFIPLGFFLLGLQGVAEIIRRLMHLCGFAERPSGERQLLERPGNG